MSNKFENFSVDSTSSRGKTYKLQGDTLLTAKDYANENGAYDPEKQLQISPASQQLAKSEALAAFSQTRLNELKAANEILLLTLFLDSTAVVQEIEFGIPNSRPNSILAGSDFSAIATKLKGLQLDKPDALAGFSFFKIILPIRFAKI